MKKYLIIKADTNDGDYTTSKTEISDETLEIIMPVIKAVKEYEDTKTTKQKYNWWNSWNFPDRHPSPEELYLKTGKVTEESLDYFSDMLPGFEGGFHSIDSIELLTVIEEVKLL